MKSDDEILGYVAIIFDGVSACDEIEVEWLGEQPYVVIHRVAVSQEGKGKKLGQWILEKIAIEREIFSIRYRY